MLLLATKYQGSHEGVTQDKSPQTSTRSKILWSRARVWPHPPLGKAEIMFLSITHIKIIKSCFLLKIYGLLLELQGVGIEYM